MQQDTLHVRSYVRDKFRGERVVVDFDESPTSDRFMHFDHTGGVIHLGAERVALDWNDLQQLAEIIRTAHKTVRLSLPGPQPKK